MADIDDSVCGIHVVVRRNFANRLFLPVRRLRDMQRDLLYQATGEIIISSCSGRMCDGSEDSDQYVSASVCQCVNMSVCRYVNISVCQYVSVSMYQYVIVSICQYVSLSVFSLSIC